MIEHSGLRAILPQRHPVLLLDRVLVLEPGRRVVAVKAVTAGEPCYRGLPEDAPPGAYAYPQSLLLESFGQAAAVLWLGAPAAAGDDGVLMLAAARGVRFTGLAYPGDVLRHEVRLDHVVGDNAFATGATWVGERRVASMESLLAVSRPPVVLGTTPADRPEVQTAIEGNVR